MHNHHRNRLHSLPCSRRTAILGGAALAASRIAGTDQPATAARGWCRTDPLVRIDDELIYVILSAPRSIRQKVTGPTELVITLPEGIEGKLVAAGPNFGEGETIRFEYSADLEQSKPGIDVKVEAHVPASEDMPIGLECARRTRGTKTPARAEGRTNSWVTLSTRFAPQKLSRKPRGKKAS